MKSKKFTPFPVLKTGRLTLRQLRADDDQEIFALRSDDTVNRYLERKRSESPDDARRFIQAINESIQKNESFYFAITLNDADRLMGTICLFNFSEEHGEAEIGFELLPEFQGKGLMQEAASAVLHFGFQQLGLKWIKAASHPENIASIRLLEKLQFVREETPGKTLWYLH